MHELMEECKSDLKTVSFDSAHEESMVDSNEVIYNFDLIQEKYYKLHNSSKPLASMDGLIVSGNRQYFIEFKNGCIDKKTKDNIKAKIPASLWTFMDLNHMRVEDIRKTVDFILVYNDEKTFVEEQLRNTDYQPSKYRNHIKNKLMKRAHQPCILFGMEQYKGIFFHDVQTLTKDEFIKVLRNIKPVCHS